MCIGSVFESALQRIEKSWIFIRCQALCCVCDFFQRVKRRSRIRRENGVYTLKSLHEHDMAPLPGKMCRNREVLWRWYPAFVVIKNVGIAEDR